ncbi:hypothetical protein ACFZDG_18315 [Kitasatospora xanthocidica]|uniref:hypothetical protein n=1 Tax=Kitasatospora xanthocidica TaxID=83382 RepID=UPI0036E3DF07
MIHTPPPALTASYEQMLRAMLAEPWTGFSRDDVATLLGEIDRLRAELDTLTAVARTNAAAHRAAVEGGERWVRIPDALPSDVARHLP